jgi:hypothetical protein
MNAMTQIQSGHDHPVSVLSSTDNGYLLFNDNKMNQIIRIAEIMATGKTTIPEHLQKSPGDCVAVCLQAAQWAMNPFAVAQKTHLVSGRLGYEAQLVIAVVNTRAPIQGRLKFEWEGNWTGINGKVCKDEKLAVTCLATFQGDTEPTAHRVSMAQAGVRNSPLWEHDPKMQLAYLCAKRWARLHCPDVILGVYTPDELEEVPLFINDESSEAPLVPALPEGASRTEKIKAKLAALNAPEPTVKPLDSGEQVDTATGEVTDPIANLLLAISECQTREELETHRSAVATLKNGQKRRAVEAWKAVEARLGE